MNMKKFYLFQEIPFLNLQQESLKTIYNYVFAN